MTRPRFVDIEHVGLTACRGDGWRDSVKTNLTMVLYHTCGGLDGPRDPANDLARLISGLRADASLARPRPQSRTCSHAVPHGSPRRSYPSVSRRPYGAHLVQLLSAPGLSTVRLSPDRALARPPAGPAAGV